VIDWKCDGFVDARLYIDFVDQALHVMQHSFLLDAQKSVWHFAQRTVEPHSTNAREFHQGSVVRDPASRSRYTSHCYWN